MLDAAEWNRQDCVCVCAFLVGTPIIDRSRRHVRTYHTHTHFYKHCEFDYWVFMQTINRNGEKFNTMLQYMLTRLIINPNIVWKQIVDELSSSLAAYKVELCWSISLIKNSSWRIDAPPHKHNPCRTTNAALIVPLTKRHFRCDRKKYVSKIYVCIVWDGLICFYFDGTPLTLSD